MGKIGLNTKQHLSFQDQTQMKTGCVFVLNILHLPVEVSTTDTGGRAMGNDPTSP